MEWLTALTHLKIWCPKSPSDILIIQNLDLKCEVFLKIFHNNRQKRKLDSKSSRRISWACDVSWLYICSNDFKYIRLDIFILRSFNVPIHNCIWSYWQSIINTNGALDKKICGKSEWSIYVFRFQHKFTHLQVAT